jgi:Trypsin-co-occurring domain 2
MADQLIPLKDVVQALRAEVAKAMEAGAQEALKFALDSVDLEFSVVVTKEGGVNGKISFHVLGIGAEVGGDGKYSQERTQKVSLKLTPKMLDPNTGKATSVEIRRR